MPLRKEQEREQDVAHDAGVLDAFFRRIFFAKHIVIPPFRTREVAIKDVLRLYWGSVRNYPFAIAFTIAGVVTASVVAILVPLYYKDFFDTLGAGGTHVWVPALRNIILIVLGLGIVNFISWRMAHFGMQYLASSMMASLRARAFDHMIGHSHRFFASSFTGTLVQRVNRFAHGYDRLADRIVYDILPILIQVTGIVVILMNTIPMIAVIILVWVAIFIGFNYIFARWKLKYDVAGAAQDSKTTGTLADIITNQGAVEAHASYEDEKERYSEQIELQRHMNRFRWNLSQSIDSVQASLIVLVEFAIFWIGIDLWADGLFSVGMFVLVQSYIIRLSNQLWSFSRIVRDLYESFADAKEMAEIMLAPHEIREQNAPKAVSTPTGEVRFERVSFSYQEQANISDFTLTVKPGERIALVGPSGAGKSTIVKLLFRFYDPSEGTISIDGTDVRDLSLVSLRSMLALVPQDSTLFHRSLLENIRYGNPEATDEEVRAAAKRAHCSAFIESLPAGYETLVGERGIKLSGGERQRVAIARAFLRNAPIIVLDEATSSLDSESERHIQAAFTELMEGRTTIVIAHRLSTIRSMDRIVIMDKGHIIEEGSHDALLTKKGMYWKLWTLQQNGFIPADIDGATQTNKIVGDAHARAQDAASHSQ